MTTRALQLSQNVAAYDVWTRVPSSYVVPAGARTILKGLMILNLGAQQASFELATSASTAPSDAERITVPTDLAAGDSAAMDSTVVMGAGYSLIAKLTGNAYYGAPSVTIQAAGLEVVP